MVETQVLFNQKMILMRDPTVYVVDDDPSARNSVCALVEPMGYHAEAFASAEEFLGACDAEQPGCLVTDLRMHGMNGLELQQALAERGITLPVIMITAFADVPVAVKAMQNGALTLLEKPCRDQELWDAIHKAMTRDQDRRGREARRRLYQQRIATLTPEEKIVLELIVSGKANKNVARQLDIGLRTVESRRHNIFKKLDARTLADLIQMHVESQGGESG